MKRQRGKKVKGIGVSLVILLFVMCVSKALGTVVIEPSDAKSVFVTVSLKDINRIELPEDVVEALSSKPIDVKIKGRNIFVKLSDSTPSELFITTERRTLPLILVPKDIPAETVIVRDKVEGSTSYTSGFTSSGMAYEETIKEIIFFPCKGNSPCRVYTCLSQIRRRNSSGAKCKEGVCDSGAYGAGGKIRDKKYLRARYGFK